MEIMPGITEYGHISTCTENYKTITNNDDNILSKLKDEHCSSDIVTGIETFDITTGLGHKLNNSTNNTNGANSLDPIFSKIPNNNTINYYLNAVTNLSNFNYINKLCIALNTLTEEDIVHLYLGSAVDDTHTINISAIIYAIQNSKATIYTHAYGFCSIPETMIWTYGKIRIVHDYGAIRFGGGEWIRRMSDAFTPYVKTYLTHCVDIGVLDNDMVDDIIVRQKEFMFIKDIDTGELIQL